jgi:cob(I)alamin adenosyltransferase
MAEFAAIGGLMVRLNKIYTRTGDGGKTFLAGGQAISKDGLRCEAYGTVDELNAVMGYVRAHLNAGDSDLPTADRDRVDQWMSDLQQQLFNLGCDLCVLPEDRRETTPTIRDENVTDLENWIDTLNEDLAPLTSFILPGGDAVAASLHLARTVCRRAERITVTLATEEVIEARCVTYLNRLSDALFVTARWTAQRAGCGENLWSP